MNTDEVGKRAAILSAIEIGLGSFLHGLNIPLAGHFLSLNQGLILSRAQVDLQDKRAAGVISTTAALLKSLSPAGKKLTPMLAIAMQGQLFGLGTLLLGNQLPGHFLGMLLLCLWGFIQPLFFYAIVFGESLWGLGEFYFAQLQKFWPTLELRHVGIALGAIVAMKVIIGWSLVVFARKLSQERLQRYEAWAMSRPRKSPSQREEPVWRSAWRDLWNLPFILGLVLLSIFWFFADHHQSMTIWVLLRPLAIAYLVFLGLRLIPAQKFSPLLEKKYPILAKSLLSALRYLSGKS